MPMTQSAPEAHRHSAYGRMASTAELNSIAEWVDPNAVTESLRKCAAKATLTTVNGCVRR